MTAPKLRVRSSGHGGSGYKHPLNGNIVPGVTTVLKKLDKPGIVQWAVDNTSAYAVANIDSLLNRTEEQGFGFLRWYWKRDPLASDQDDIRNYSAGVLNDAANLGTLMHDWIAAEHDELPYPDVSLAPEYFWQMVAQWDEWKTQHEIEPLMTETTLWSHQYGYAGTADGLWMIDGVPTMLDIKTSRNVWDEHFMQLSALGACEVAVIESDNEWVEIDIPAFSQYALLHIRPEDTTKHGEYMEPFCRLEVVDMEEIPLHFEAFLGLLAVSEAQNRVREHRKGGRS
jgi:hypothetical protein